MTNEQMIQEVARISGHDYECANVAFVVVKHYSSGIGTADGLISKTVMRLEDGECPCPLDNG